MRGILAGALTLIVMQAFSSGKGPEQGGKLLTWVSGGLRKALSPEVAAIPYVKGAAPAKKNDSSAPAQSPGVSLPRNPPLTGGPVTV